MNGLKQKKAALSASGAVRDGNRSILLATFLFAGTMLVYAQVWTFDFATLDDSRYVPGNPYVLQGLTLESVAWSLTANLDSNWIPLTAISLMLDTEIYGGAFPGGYHLTNALLHAADTVLLFAALVCATRNRMRSAFVAALFALHPLHVESVAWVAERKDVLSTLFGMSSLLCYVRYARGAHWRTFALSLVFFILSLMSKQMYVTLPFVFLLLDYWPLRRLMPDVSVSQAGTSRARDDVAADVPGTYDGAVADRQSSARGLLAEKAPFIAISAIFSIVAVMAQSYTGAVMSLRGFPLGVRCMNAVLVYATYLWKAFYPLNLAVYYPHPGTNISVTAVVLAGALLLAVTAASVVWIRRFPCLFVGWCWYLGTLVPVIGIMQIGTQQMADRYTYFPLVGVFLAIAWLVPEIVPVGIGRSRILPIVAIASIVALAVMTFRQVSLWHDSITLLRHSMASTPDNIVAHEFLGSALLSHGDVNEAVAELQAAIQMKPKYAPLHLSLATGLQRLGRSDEAIGEYRAALAINDKSPVAHGDLGAIYLKRRQFGDAKREFLKAIELDPNYLQALANTASMCAETGDYAGAIRYGERALKMNPGLLSCHHFVALGLRGQGRLDEAIRRLQNLVEMAPDDQVARQELARTLAMKHERSQSAGRK